MQVDINTSNLSPLSNLNFDKNSHSCLHPIKADFLTQINTSLDGYLYVRVMLLSLIDI